MKTYQQNTEQQLFQILNSYHMKSKELEKSAGLTQERLQILMLLVIQGPKTINQLAEGEKVSAPAITRTVKALEKQGYVIKSRSKTDQRVVYVAPTRKSQQIIESIRSKQKKLIAELVKGHSDEELRAIGLGAGLLVKRTL
ncbi:MarR family winged helix-turn-helix transcriptional regulator [Kangiella shandongensis]|uniref:MarR family winged helix-turn-helix transcriptional regulator n=1 Tax=Kangiella shandongensis TaxID=2763258 RepID=UPI001CBD53C2|nr:MarR family transcriptional regulator [Kangiella shandongensis]